MEKIVSIRGAITVVDNSVKEIKTATITLIKELFNQNKLDKSKITNIIFTVTDDLNEINPATITREEFKLELIPMLCLQEMKLKNGLPRCIRVMVNVQSELTKEQIKHTYLDKASNLRPDLGMKY